MVCHVVSKHWKRLGSAAARGLPSRGATVRFEKWWTTFALILAASCGSRSGLLDLATGAGGHSGGGGQPTGGGGHAGSIVDGSAGATGGSTFDAGPDAAGAPPCVLVSAGPVKEIVSFPDRHATAPSLVTVNPGSNGESARVALQTFASGDNSFVHDDIEVVRVIIGPSFPDQAVIDQGPTLVGIEAHGWALLAPGLGGPG